MFSYKEPIIIGFFGELGEGKTIGLTYLSLKYHRFGMPVFHNGYGFKYGESIDRLLKIRKLRDCFVGIDDIVTELDARESHSGENKFVSWCLRALRKTHLILVYTCQLMSDVDKRMRKLTNIVVNSYNYGFPKFRLVIATKEGRILKDTFVRYGSDVFNSFETDNIIYKRIRLDELNRMMNLCDSKSMFQGLGHLELGMPRIELGNVYDGLKNENIEYIKELFDNKGYMLVM